jgi:hypothetical protein
MMREVQQNNKVAYIGGPQLISGITSTVFADGLQMPKATTRSDSPKYIATTNLCLEVNGGSGWPSRPRCFAWPPLSRNTPRNILLDLLYWDDAPFINAHMGPLSQSALTISSFHRPDARALDPFF